MVSISLKRSLKRVLTIAKLKRCVTVSVLISTVFAIKRSTAVILSVGIILPLRAEL